MFTGKAKRLKQAKEEAQDEVERYRQERERQFKEFEAKVCPDWIHEPYLNTKTDFDW